MLSNELPSSSLGGRTSDGMTTHNFFKDYIGHVAKWVDALRSNRSEFDAHESSNLSMTTDKMIGSNE